MNEPMNGPMNGSNGRLWMEVVWTITWARCVGAYCAAEPSSFADPTVTEGAVAATRWCAVGEGLPYHHTLYVR